MTKKILTIVGARPQFVKAAVVSRAIADTPGLAETIVHTGQHFDVNMSDVFFSEMGIPAPSFSLGIGGGSHGENTGRMIEAIERVMLEQHPDSVLVYGDTDSTLAGAIAAAKLNIPIAHVEAGLRSFNRRMPEEVNRVLTDHVSTLLFAPSASSVKNLVNEGVAEGSIHLVGDVMFDAVLAFTQVARKMSRIIGQLALSAGEYVLVTLHRKENTDDRDRLGAILAGLQASPVPVVLPLHPRTRKRLQEHGIQLPASLRVLDPVGYLDMLMLEANARVIATDSGGVQKEAYFHGVPCVTLRDETEWVELVDVGANQLVGADSGRIAAALTAAQPLHGGKNLYGRGDAATRIASVLSRQLGTSTVPI